MNADEERDKQTHVTIGAAMTFASRIEEIEAGVSRKGRGGRKGKAVIEIPALMSTPARRGSGRLDF
jgi:hypothetical protein